MNIYSGLWLSASNLVDFTFNKNMSDISVDLLNDGWNRANDDELLQAVDDFFFATKTQQSWQIARLVLRYVISS